MINGLLLKKIINLKINIDIICPPPLCCVALLLLSSLSFLFPCSVRRGKKIKEKEFSFT